jgi:hypothetical protein
VNAGTSKLPSWTRFAPDATLGASTAIAVTAARQLRYVSDERRTSRL